MFHEGDDKTILLDFSLNMKNFTDIFDGSEKVFQDNCDIIIIDIHEDNYFFYFPKTEERRIL